MNWNGFLAGSLRALRFYTRLPIPVLRFEIDPHAPPDMRVLAPVAPIAGAAVGIAGGMTLLVAALLGLGGLPAATLAAAAMVLVTGAMHEDALGDVADGFGGGRTIERKLEIMRDPRLGSYGAVAIGLALIFRIGVIATLAASLGVFAAAAAIVGAAAIARTFGLWPLVRLAPARSDGSGAAAGTLPGEVFGQSFVVGGAIGLVALLFAVGPAGLLAPVLALAATHIITTLAEKQIGGQTGDVCGAATQLAELAFLGGLAMVASSV